MTCACICSGITCFPGDDETPPFQTRLCQIKIGGGSGVTATVPEGSDPTLGPLDDGTTTAYYCGCPCPSCCPEDPGTIENCPPDSFFTGISNCMSGYEFKEIMVINVSIDMFSENELGIDLGGFELMQHTFTLPGFNEGEFPINYTDCNSIKAGYLEWRTGQIVSAANDINQDYADYLEANLPDDTEILKIMCCKEILTTITVGDPPEDPLVNTCCFEGTANQASLSGVANGPGLVTVNRRLTGNSQINCIIQSTNGENVDGGPWTPYAASYIYQRLACDGTYEELCYTQYTNSFGFNKLFIQLLGCQNFSISGHNTKCGGFPDLPVPGNQQIAHIGIVITPPTFGTICTEALIYKPQFEPVDFIEAQTNYKVREGFLKIDTKDKKIYLNKLNLLHKDIYQSMQKLENLNGKSKMFIKIRQGNNLNSFCAFKIIGDIKITDNIYEVPSELIYGKMPEENQILVLDFVLPPKTTSHLSKINKLEILKRIKKRRL